MKNANDREYRRPEQKPNISTTISGESGGILGGGTISIQATNNKQLLQDAGRESAQTDQSFFLGHAAVSENLGADKDKGRDVSICHPLGDDQYSDGDPDIVAHAQHIKDQLGEKHLQDIVLVVSPTIRCLQTLQIMLRQWYGDQGRYLDTPQMKNILETYNKVETGSMNINLDPTDIQTIHDQLGLPDTIVLDTFLNSRKKADPTMSDSNILSGQKNLYDEDGPAGQGFVDVLKQSSQGILTTLNTNMSKGKIVVFIGHRTGFESHRALKQGTKISSIDLHPKASFGVMDHNVYGGSQGKKYVLEALQLNDQGSQISPFVLPFPPTNWIAQHQPLIPGLDPAKTYIENQNIVSAWILSYAQQLHQLIQDKQYDTLKEQLICVDQSTMVSQTALSVLLPYQTDPEIHALLIQVLDHAVKNHHVDSDWITNTFERLVDDANTSKTESKSDIYRKYCLALLHQSGQSSSLIAQLGDKHPRHQDIQQYLGFLNTQQQQHDAIRMKTLGGEMSLESAYVDQKLSDTSGNMLSPLELVQQFLVSTDTRVFITAAGGMGKSTLSKKIVSLLTDPRVLTLCHQPALKVQEVDLRGYSLTSLPSSQSLDPSTIIVIDGIDEIDPQVLDAYMSLLSPGIRVIGLGRHDVTDHFSGDTKYYGLDVSDFESRLLQRYTQGRPGLRELYTKLKQKLHFDLAGREIAPLQIEALIKLAEDTELSGEFENISRSNIYEYMIRDIMARDAKRLQTIGILQQYDTAPYSKDKEQLFEYLIRSGYRSNGKSNHVRDRSKSDILALQDEYLTAYQGETKLTPDSFKDFVDRFLTTTSLLVHSGPTDRYRVFHETARESFLNLKGGSIQKINGDEYYITREDTSYTIANQTISNNKLQTMIHLQSQERIQSNLLSVQSGQYDVFAIKTSAIEELIKQRNMIPQIGDELTIDDQQYIVVGRDPHKSFQGRDYKSMMVYLSRCDQTTKQQYTRQLAHTRRNSQHEQVYSGGLTVNKEYLELLVKKTVPVILDELPGELIEYEQDYKVPLQVKKIIGTLLIDTKNIVDQHGHTFERIATNTEHYYKLLSYIKSKDESWRNQHCFLLPDDTKNQYQLYISPQGLQEFDRDVGTILQRTINPDTNTVMIDGTEYYYVGSGINWTVDPDGGLQATKAKDSGKSLFAKLKKLNQSLVKQAITPAGKKVDVINEQTLKQLLDPSYNTSTQQKLLQTLS